MKQVVLRNGQAVVEEVPAPALLPGSVLVRVAFSCVSPGTETATLATTEVKMGLGLVKSALRHPDRVRQVLTSLRTRGFRATRALVEGRLGFGSAVGYSCAGIVAEVGEGVESFRPGDRVACAGSGYANHAEAVVVPQNLAVTVPAQVELLPAATVTLGAIALQGVRRAQPALGETIGVIGLGLLGQLTAQLLKAAGCRVVGLDLQRARVDLARSLGMDEGLVPTDGDPGERVRNLTEGYGLDAVIITAATRSDEPVNLAMRLARRKGRVVVVGDVGLGLQRPEMYRKELDLLMSTSYGPGRYDPLYEEGGLDYPYAYVRWTENRNMAAYLDLVAGGKIQLVSLLAAVYPLTEAAAAYQALRAEGGPLTVLLQNPLPAEDRPLSRRIVLPSRTAAPTGRVRVAIIGAGGFAQSTHLPNLKQLADRYEIRAIVSRTGTTATAAARQYGAAVAATDYREVLDDKEIDAVLICTRHDLHARQAADALRAGKHVFLEKPMAIERDELAELYKTIRDLRAAGICPAFLVGFNRRFSPCALRAKDIIAGRLHPLLIRYRMNAGPLPPDHWVNGPEGGGRAVGEACHILDLFRSLTGSPAEGVTATPIRPQSAACRADENFVATLRYRDGSVCTLMYTALGARDFPKEAMEIYADGKVLALDDYRSLEIHGGKGAGLRTSLQDKGHRAELEAFHRLVTGQAEAPMTPEEMVEVTELSLAIRDQVRTGGFLPPEMRGTER
ncbi:MAG: bi-domain-containing oxidoreductase [candidate division NC10 bacterium]|nr:bi-domain-containing oxidoreductase [candidate division NC10 bacterium]MBI2163463.1 bi-domain-containing oxidoreductase [candidate division NC10 bacterium]